MISAFAANGSKLFAAHSSSNIFVSVDDGLNWFPKNVGQQILNIKALMYTGSSIIAGSDVGVFISEDDGDSWTRINHGFQIQVFGI